MELTCLVRALVSAPPPPGSHACEPQREQQRRPGLGDAQDLVELGGCEVVDEGADDHGVGRIERIEVEDRSAVSLHEVAVRPARNEFEIGRELVDDSVEQRAFGGNQRVGVGVATTSLVAVADLVGNDGHVLDRAGAVGQRRGECRRPAVQGGHDRPVARLVGAGRFEACGGENEAGWVGEVADQPREDGGVAESACSFRRSLVPRVV